MGFVPTSFSTYAPEHLGSKNEIREVVENFSAASWAVRSLTHDVNGSMEVIMAILNLTQHVASPEQLAAGVVEPSDKEAIRASLTFATLPSQEDLGEACHALCAAAAGFESAMIGGAPFLMRPLAESLQGEGITPLFAFSKRESVESVESDGSVRKVAVFRHLGFVKG